MKPLYLTPIIVHPGATGVSETELPPAVVKVDFDERLGVLRLYVKNEGLLILHFSAYPQADKPWWKRLLR